jgi:hypothetical protein
VIYIRNSDQGAKMNATETKSYTVKSGDMECTIERTLYRYAYPRNGNAHNPSPYFRWTVSYKGRRVGSQRSLKDAKSLAVEFMADPEW